MKLLVATGLFPPEIGGPATHSKLLADGLPKYGIGVAVLPFREVRKLPKLARHLVYALRVIQASRDADLIYAQDTISVGMPVAFATLLTRKKFIVRVPGDYAWEQGMQRFGVKESLDSFQEHRYGTMVEVMRAAQRFVLRRAAIVVVPSHYMKSIVEKWGIPSEKIRVIYSSVELPVSAEGPTYIGEGFLIVSIGRLVPWKGIDRLINVVKRHASWRLVIVGDGPERKRLETLIKGAEERIVLTGPLPRAQALGWAKTAHVFVLNSTYEGLSHLLIEVMSLSKPIIATRAGGNPELIENEKSGILIPPEDDIALENALMRVEMHPEEARTWGMQALKRLEGFSTEQELYKLCDIFKTIEL